MASLRARVASDALANLRASPMRCERSEQPKSRWVAGRYHEYNEVRPHAALSGAPPAARHLPSPRVYPASLPALEYPAHFLVKRVTHAARSASRIGCSFSPMPSKSVTSPRGERRRDLVALSRIRAVGQDRRGDDEGVWVTPHPNQSVTHPSGMTCYLFSRLLRTIRRSRAPRRSLASARAERRYSDWHGIGHTYRRGLGNRRY